ncbi:MAG: DUF2207 domain-containing protein [Oscillospiraceae bacterium]|nr:DUF2207 domain-containing protein [Oscillospiraceae bacterium]MBQ7129749.1 DUF2207 domain-containing protein [Oscillospiraceae bacterium]
MKRIITVLFALVLLSSVLCLPASAESAASKVDLYATVNSEGDCLVTMTVNLRLEAMHDKMTFPLPLNAKGITLNGSNVSTTKSASSIDVDISKITTGYVGDASMRFEFTIPEVVQVVKLTDSRQLQMDIPLLSGFVYPVENLSFVINMPQGEMPNSPVFTSIYRQGSFESDLDFRVSGNQIIGSSTAILHDHEGVNMTMIVTQDMFPTVSTYMREGNPELPFIIGFAVAALLYWLLTLRTWPLVRIPTSTPPEGVTAGEMGCRLTLSGGDLTMMVFTWAQLGYLIISLDGNGKVLLHKRMDMGNERGPFENKVYRQLFGNRRVVDATGNTYAKLVRKVAAQVPQERVMYKGNSGNMKIFRGLACVCQILCGVNVALNMNGFLPVAIALAVILGIFGAVSGWMIQGIAYRTHLRGKVPVLIGLICIVIWIILGLLCGQVWIPLGCSLGQWLYGYFAAYGGRRSDLGRHDGGQVLGLRRYLKHLNGADINRLMMNDPDYFFNMAPYALAMGIINPYAKRFGRRKVGQCPYLVTRVAGKKTAEEWAHLMADTADLMDHRSRQMQLERFFLAQFRS